MKRAPRSLVVALLATVPLAQTTNAPTAADALFAAWDRPDTPGAAVAVVQDGKIVHEGGYGLANVEHSVPITPETVFDIASVSKQFAGLAIAMLVERGDLSLDDEVREHLPEFPDFGATVNVRHLVHHTSGRSFRAWTHGNLFAPLGMADTHFQTDHREVVPGRAYGYEPGEGGAFVALHDGLTAQGSSSLFTTVRDLAKWVANFDEPRVGEAAHARMHERGVLNDGTRIAYAFGVSIGSYRGLRTVAHGGAWAGFRTHVVRVPAHRALHADARRPRRPRRRLRERGAGHLPRAHDP